MIRSMIEDIQKDWEDQAVETQGEGVLPRPRKVFLVHGHDEGAREGIAKFLESIDLEIMVLAAEPSRGMTIIEKFEACSEEVGYAIVLLTADDSGALKGEELQPRARQNVIFELGFFIGKLGRAGVCVLTKGDPEIPSDYAGVVYIPMDGPSQWQMSLIQELKAAGLEVDANRAFD